MMMIETDEAVRRIYRTIEEASNLCDQDIEEVGCLLGCDGPDLDAHQRGRAVQAALRALRGSANSIFYLLPDLDDGEA